MCLGVPGKVVDVEIDPSGLPMGRIDFGGITKRVCLAYTPDAEVGEYVVVHVGFAISKIDEEEARHVFDLLAEMEELAELGIAQPDDEPPEADDAALTAAPPATPAASDEPEDTDASAPGRAS